MSRSLPDSPPFSSQPTLPSSQPYTWMVYRRAADSLDANAREWVRFTENDQRALDQSEQADWPSSISHATSSTSPSYPLASCPSTMVEHGRYIVQNKRMKSIYWQEPDYEVLKGSWFFKSPAEISNGAVLESGTPAQTLTVNQSWCWSCPGLSIGDRLTPFGELDAATIEEAARDLATGREEGPIDVELVDSLFGGIVQVTVEKVVPASIQQSHVNVQQHVTNTRAELPGQTPEEELSIWSRLFRKSPTVELTSTVERPPGEHPPVAPQPAHLPAQPAHHSDTPTPHLAFHYYVTLSDSIPRKLPVIRGWPDEAKHPEDIETPGCPSWLIFITHGIGEALNNRTGDGEIGALRFRKKISLLRKLLNQTWNETLLTDRQGRANEHPQSADEQTDRRHDHQSAKPRHTLPAHITSHQQPLATDSLTSSPHTHNRTLSSSSTSSKQLGRVELVPVEWLAATHSREMQSWLNKIALPSLERARDFVNLAIRDVLLYTQSDWKNRVLAETKEQINSKYKLFCEHHPEFPAKLKQGKCGVAFIGHSLGAVILSDLLEQYHDTHHGTASSSADHPREHPLVHVDAGLMIKPSVLFTMGSPVGLFRCVRGESLFKSLPCKHFFNVYHPHDPIAYRLEPLILPGFTQPFGQPRTDRAPNEPTRPDRNSLTTMTTAVSPMRSASLAESDSSDVGSLPEQLSIGDPASVPHRGGKRLHVALSALGTSLWSWWQGQPNPSVPSPVQAEIAKLNSGQRVDWVLQASPGEAASEWLSAMSSHFTYWTHEDVINFIVNQLLIVSTDKEKNTEQSQQFL